MKLLNVKEQKQVFSSQHTLSKNLPILSEIQVDYMAINPKHNPDTQEGRVESQKIKVTAKGASTSMTNALKMLIERTKEIV